MTWFLKLISRTSSPVLDKDSFDVVDDIRIVSPAGIMVVSGKR